MQAASSIFSKSASATSMQLPANSRWVFKAKSLPISFFGSNSPRNLSANRYWTLQLEPANMASK